MIIVLEEITKKTPNIFTAQEFQNCIFELSINKDTLFSLLDAFHGRDFINEEQKDYLYHLLDKLIKNEFNEYILDQIPTSQRLFFQRQDARLDEIYSLLPNVIKSEDSTPKLSYATHDSVLLPFNAPEHSILFSAYIAEAKTILENTPIVHVYGLPKYGKTTFAKQLACELSQSSSVHFMRIPNASIDENTSFFFRYTNAIKSISANANVVLFIDEAQNLAENPILAEIIQSECFFQSNLSSFPGFLLRCLA